MTAENLEIVFRLLVALVAGAAIGFERSYQGRPAGIRTHALVCTASSLLMLVTAYETRWMHVSGDLVRLDPTRMAQGIMTGIGFLVPGSSSGKGWSAARRRPLIWMTAAIGLGRHRVLFFAGGGVVITLRAVLFRFSRSDAIWPISFDLKFPRATAFGGGECAGLVESWIFSQSSYALDAEVPAGKRSFAAQEDERPTARKP
jgi:putative Mg2+ transporter-C (MgtC) family protein